MLSSISWLLGRMGLRPRLTTDGDPETEDAIYDSILSGDNDKGEEAGHEPGTDPKPQPPADEIKS